MNSFEQNINKIYENRGKKWIIDLPKKVEELKRRWNLDNLIAFSNLSYNYVLEGYQKGLPIVLKISLDELTLRKEAEALMAFAGYGVIKILAQSKEALLLQKAVPGQLLKNAFPKGSSLPIKIACEITKKLHQAPVPKNHSFPHIEDFLKALDRKWNISLFHLEKARAVKNNLLKTKTSTVLLHGDLHQSNILSDGDDWLVIDPKGVIGLPINEVWAFVEDLEIDLHLISEYFNFNFCEVIQWYYVHVVLTACWQVKHDLDPDLFLNLAQKISPMIKD